MHLFFDSFYPQKQLSFLQWLHRFPYFLVTVISVFILGVVLFEVEEALGYSGYMLIHILVD